MGTRLLEIVDRIRENSNGLPNIDLARLNLIVGQPLSRRALELPDDPEVVARAESAATEILSSSEDK